MRHRWLTFPLFGAFLLLSACTVWKEHAVSDWKQATGGEGLERSYWNDVKAKNWADLERHLASNYLSVGADGKLDRAAMLDRLKRMQVEEFSLGDLQTELHGDTFVVTYALTLRGRLDGKSFPEQPVRWMTVWQQQKAGWVAIAQSAMVPASAKPQ